MDVHNNDRLSKILHLLGGSGASISEDSLSGKKINKSIFQKIFNQNFYANYFLCMEIY